MKVQRSYQRSAWRQAFRAATPIALCLGIVAARPLSERATKDDRQGGAAAIAGAVMSGDSKMGISLASVVLSGAGGLKRQLTDDKGRFVFTGLSGGNYTISASATGFFGGRAGQDVPVAGSLPTSIPVRPGEFIDDVKVILWRPGFIGGVTYDQLGNVVTGALVGAHVYTEFGQRRVLATAAVARTDDRGRFYLGGLPDGAYIVSVSGFDLVAPLAMGRRTVYGRSFYPSGSSPGSAQPVPLRLGEAREVDLRMESAPAVSIHGRLEFSGALPPNLPVSLFSVDDTVSEEAAAAPEAVQQAAADGRFTFAAVRPGRYWVMVGVEAPELSVQLPAGPWAPNRFVQGQRDGVGLSLPFGLAAFVSSSPDGPRLWGRTQVDVGDDGLTGVTVPLRMKSVVRGVVRYAGSAAPQAGLLQSSMVGMPGGSVAPVDSVSGRFELSLVSVSNVFLRLRHWTPHVVESITWQGRDVLPIGLDVSTGDVDDVVVVVSNSSATIRGTALDAKRSPVTEGTVFYAPSRPEMWSAVFSLPGAIGSVAIRRDGSFEIGSRGVDLLPGGDYSLVALRIGDSIPTSQALRVRLSGATRVSAKAGETVTCQVTVN